MKYIINSIFIIANMLCAAMLIDTYIREQEMTALMVAFFNLSAVIILASNNASQKDL